MQRVIIIDGHSVIHSTAVLEQLHAQDMYSARVKLHRDLSDFQCISDYSVLIVFDGKGAKRSKERGSDSEAMVIYSSGGETADAVIEKLCVKYAQRYDVSVVSNDRMVLDSVSASGGFSMSVRHFWEIVESC